MSDDWKPGDLALCVALPHPDRTTAVRRGGIYTVENVVQVEGEIGLFLVGHRDARGPSIAWGATGFRRIPPLTSAERDEFIADLKAPSPSVVEGGV